jgi:hypothetical protein
MDEKTVRTQHKKPMKGLSEEVERKSLSVIGHVIKD